MTTHHADDVALIGEVKPVAWCLRYNDPRCGPIHSNPSMCKPELEEMECVTSGRVSIENLFTADQLATAVANERERAAKVCEARAITNDTPGALYARDCAEAIRGQE